MVHHQQRQRGGDCVLNQPVIVKHTEKGQAAVFMILASGIFLFGVMGLALDISRWYTEKQAVTAGADAAAEAAMMSVFDGTNSGGTSPFFPPAAITCTGGAGDPAPCQYATFNGLNQNGDSVNISFPASAAGVSLSPYDPYPVTQVNVQRPVPLTLMNYFLLANGFSTSNGPLTVNVQATAAIVMTESPVPLIVTHPTLTQAFTASGPLTLCGGPQRGIQVNSSDPAAVNLTAVVNLSNAGPTDPAANCSGTGADFGVWGQPTAAPAQLTLGTGNYIEPASPIWDPLASVAAPALPAAHAPPVTDTPGGPFGCPATAPANCTVYYPGLYNGAGDSIPAATDTNTVMAFTPGIYYMQGANFGSGTEAMLMAVGQTDTATGTGWTGNMLVYMTGTGVPAATGAINITSNVIAGLTPAVNLVGAPITTTNNDINSAYDGMLFFADPTSAAQTHTISDLGGGILLSGTIYITNTLPLMLANPAQYQTLQLQGNGTTSVVDGEIITSALSVSGNGFTVARTPGSTGTSTAEVLVRQIALVN